MIYTDLTRKAMNIAFSAHFGQCDKAGVPYIFHPIHVAEQMEDEISTAVALLHDVVEDTDITAEMLLEMGFPCSVVDSVVTLTHLPNMIYDSYISSIASNEVARKVKIADMKHNADLTRLPNPTDKDIKRQAKYIASLDFLSA